MPATPPNARRRPRRGQADLDINFGDPITPAPELIDYPALQPGMTPVRILGYPDHLVLAEKITTAVNVGAASTRVHDHLDLWTLTGIHDLDAAQTRAAIEVTATHRQITLRPLSQAVAHLATTRAQTYTAFLRRLGPDAEPLPNEPARVRVGSRRSAAWYLVHPHPITACVPDNPFLWAQASRVARRSRTSGPPDGQAWSASVTAAKAGSISAISDGLSPWSAARSRQRLTASSTSRRIARALRSGSRK
jgi:hypothetical protein